MWWFVGGDGHICVCYAEQTDRQIIWGHSSYIFAYFLKLKHPVTSFPFLDFTICCKDMTLLCDVTTGLTQNREITLSNVNRPCVSRHMRILLLAASESAYCLNSSFYQSLYIGNQFTAVLQTYVVARLLRISLHLMKPQSSLRCSQETATGSCRKTAWSNSQPPTLFH